jgi:hypothetical protein
MALRLLGYGLQATARVSLSEGIPSLESRLLCGSQHFDVGNAVFEILPGDNGETQITVEGLQMRLSADAHGVRREVLIEILKRHSDERPADPAATVRPGRQYSANGRLCETGAGVQHTQVRRDLSTRPADKVAGVEIQSIEFLIGARLFDDEDRLTRCQHCIQLLCGQFVE